MPGDASARPVVDLAQPWEACTSKDGADITMTVQGINHINLNAPRPLLDRLRDFYVDVVGLADGWRPATDIPGYWLYAGDTPIMHLMDMGERRGPDPEGHGHLDHIAFSCTDIDATEQRLQRAGVEFQRRDAPDMGFSQLMLKDPAGLMVELNFSQ